MRLINPFLFTLLLLSVAGWASGGNKYSAASGLWNNPLIWLPNGVPQPGDHVHIMPGHSITIPAGISHIASASVRKNGILILSQGTVLHVDSLISVSGEFRMNNGDIQAEPATIFELRDSAVFIWEPGTNSSAGASLFINSNESFSPASTLIIKKWYDYNIPLATDINGHFGNLTLSSVNSNMIMEWNQNNLFSTHKILGTLTVVKGWIVLDKSGSLQQTEIGKIRMENTNSYLDFHGGNHPSSFKILTHEIFNYGGEINGIYNGNGDIELEVTGTVTNYGNIALIRNTGIMGTGNGNVKFTVGENFIQHTGDFRGIYNLSSFQSGTVNLNFNNLTVKNGIFLGQYACHTSNGKNVAVINGDLTVDLSLNASKFRITGLTSLAGTFNNAKTEFTVHGKTILRGNPQAEFTSSGGTGRETFLAADEFKIEGLNVSFNLGTHETILTFNNNVLIENGNASFSRMNGNTEVNILKNLIVSGGMLSLKNNQGPAQMNISGDFIQSGGMLAVYSNPVVIAGENLIVELHGNFQQTSGQINLCDNVSSLQPVSLILKSKEVVLNGNASITRSGNAFGKLIFSNNGVTQFKRLSNAHRLNQLKIEVEDGCTLNIQSGNLQIASSALPATDLLIVKGGATLRMNNSKIFSNMAQSHSGIRIENGGRFSLQHTNGFFTGDENACLSASGNMNFELQPHCIIEYNGTENQSLTGISGMSNPKDHHKYGILEINFQNQAAGKRVALAAPGVYVRTQLKLTKGELNLNNYPLVIESGNGQAILSVNGYIKSDVPNAVNNGYVDWRNLSTHEIHVIPFGVSSTELIPFQFSLKTGAGKSIQVSTRSTGPANQPFPSASPPITAILRNGTDISVSQVIDRYYCVNATGIKADVEISYLGKENTLYQHSEQRLGIQCYENGKWSKTFGQGHPVISGTGKITARNVTSFGHWIISTPSNSIPASGFTAFTATLENNSARLSWEVEPSLLPMDHFKVQRGSDASSVSTIHQLNVTNVSQVLFEFDDKITEEGYYLYRIAAVRENGEIVYSSDEWISYIRTNTMQSAPDIISVRPNPYKSYFDMTYAAPRDGGIELSLVNASGQTVFSKQLIASKGTNTFRYEESHNLSPGVYVLMLGYGNNYKTKKIFRSE